MQGAKQVPVKGKRKPRVSNQVKLDVVNPIPFEFGGLLYSFVNNSAYLPFLPPKDDFAQMLVEARMLSVAHNACVTTKRDYCTGEGFQDADGNEIKKPILDWFKSMNLRNESATALNKKIFEDFFTYGNVPIELVRFTVANKKYLYVYAHSFLEWRLGRPNDDDNVDYALQSKLFIRRGYLTADQIKHSKRLPIYNPLKKDKDNWWVDKEKNCERTLIWYRNPVSGMIYYGLPSAVASMIYQVLEYKAARYNLDNFDNNMVVAGILALKGQLGQEEANRIGKNILDTHTGDGKRGRTVVVASEEGIEKSDFHPMDTKTDGSYKEADDKWTQKIILANQWDPILAGIDSPGTMGRGQSFITKIQELKLNTVVRPAQRDLVDNVWRDIFLIADKWLGLGLKDVNLEIKNSIDISGLTDVDITQAVQINEVREGRGLEPDPKMDGVYMVPPKGQGSGNSGGGDGGGV